MVNEEVKFTLVAEDGFSEVIKDFKEQWADVKSTLERGVESKANVEKPTAGATKPTTGIGGEKEDKAAEKNKSALADMLKGGKKKEGEEPEVEGGMKIPKEWGTFLRAIGMYRAAWLTGRQIGGKEKETGKTSKEGMLMGAAAGIFVLQSIKDGIMKVVQILADASPLLRAQLKMLNIGFMQIIKPFGDMIGAFVRPLARAMLRQSRLARQALREAGVSMREEPEEYMKGYIDMTMHGLYHGLFKGEMMPENDFLEIAEKYKQSQEEIDWKEYLKGLGATDEQLKKFNQLYDNKSSIDFLNREHNILTQEIRQAWEKKTGREALRIEDFLKLSQEEQASYVSNTLLIDSNWAIVDSNTKLTTVMDWLRTEMSRRIRSPYAGISGNVPGNAPDVRYNELWDQETGGFLNEYQRGMGRAWRL